MKKGDSKKPETAVMGGKGAFTGDSRLQKSAVSSKNQSCFAGNAVTAKPLKLLSLTA